MEKLRIGCVVMAAGNGSRFGRNKLAAEVDGKTLLRRALEASGASECVRMEAADAGLHCVLAVDARRSESELAALLGSEGMLGRQAILVEATCADEAVDVDTPDALAHAESLLRG